jgi:hypothetical protein
MAALVAFAAHGQQPARAPVGPPPPTPAPAVSMRYDAFCIDADKAGVTQNWANEDLDKKEGWNPELRHYAQSGWEPFQLVTTGSANRVTPAITAVCFRRQLP